MKKIAVLTCLSFLTVVVTGAAGCVQETVSYDSKKITIVNESGQALSLREDKEAGSLPPGEAVTGAFSGPDIEISLENDKGELVFEKTFNYTDLEGMNYRVVIPPSDGNASHGDAFFKQLLAAPEKYNGQTITFTGYVFHGFESAVICEFLEERENQKDSYRPGGVQIWYTGNLPEEVNEKLQVQNNDPTGYPAYYGKVEITGIIQYGESYGHLGAYKYQLQVTGAKLIKWDPAED
jgi:hypothetical protein